MKVGPPFSRLISFIFYTQPFFTFAVFLSVLIGTPPLWLSWLIALAPLSVRLLITGRVSRRTPFDLPILISVAAMASGFWFTPDHQFGITLLNSYLACVLLYYGITGNETAPKIYWILWCVFVSIVLLLLSFSIFRGGVEARHVIFNEWTYRLANSTHWPMSLNGSLNIVGDAFAVVIPGLVSISLFQQKTWLRWSAAVLASVFVFIIVLSASGGAWIVLAAVVLFVFRRYNSKVFSAAAALLVATSILLYSFRSVGWVSSTFSITSLITRFEVWRETIAALQHSPLWGFGVGGWWLKMPAYIVAQGNPHNAYLQLYSDTGALGFAALVVAVIIAVKLIWRIWLADKNNPDYGIALGVAAGIIAFGLHALVEVNTNLPISFGDKTIYFAIPFIWVWAAFLVVSHKRLVRE